MTRKLTQAQARRVAITAQGLTSPRPAKVGPAALKRVIARLGVLQLDSVNVFERSHYLPLLARLGPYDRSILDRLLQHDQPSRRLGGFTEYVTHEACVLPIADWPLWAWHRASGQRDGFRGWAADQASLISEVRREFEQRGPSKISELEHPANVKLGGGWWHRNDAYWAAVWLFRRGELAVVGRQRFERILAVTTDVMPESLLDAWARRESMQELVRRAAKAYGVATVKDLGDYYRLSRSDAKAAVATLVAAGELEEVSVEGWGEPGYLWVATRIPRAVTAAALLSPFDPLVWCRDRAERLFHFHYRIAIYTPAAQREHGYYVLPVLIDDELVGRVDLKRDREAGRLLVQHAHIEPGQAARADELAPRLAALLREAATWQGLGDVVPPTNGTWAPQLLRVLR